MEGDRPNILISHSRKPSKRPHLKLEGKAQHLMLSFDCHMAYRHSSSIRIHTHPKREKETGRGSGEGRGERKREIDCIDLITKTTKSKKPNKLKAKRNLEENLEKSVNQ